MYLYSQIALAIARIARAITGHTHTSKNTDYCPNCTQKCVINYTNKILLCRLCWWLEPACKCRSIEVKSTPLICFLCLTMCVYSLAFKVASVPCAPMSKSVYRKVIMTHSKCEWMKICPVWAIKIDNVFEFEDFVRFGIL